jgi:hypothetical protein
MFKKLINWFISFLPNFKQFSDPFLDALTIEGKLVSGFDLNIIKYEIDLLSTCNNKDEIEELMRQYLGTEMYSSGSVRLTKFLWAAIHLDLIEDVFKIRDKYMETEYDKSLIY